MKKKSMMSILSIVILVFGMLLPGVLAKRPVEPAAEKSIVTFLEDPEFDIEGAVEANKWVYRWRVHFRANYPHHVIEPPTLTFSEAFDKNDVKFSGLHEGNDFELDINEKKTQASLYFAWEQGGKRYRLLVSGDYTEESGVYTLSNAQAEIYWMKRPKGVRVLGPFDVTFSFEYS